MKKLLWLALLLPTFANAQWVNGVIQRDATPGWIRYLQGANAVRLATYADLPVIPVGLSDSLTKKANRTFDNVASGAIPQAKVSGLVTDLAGKQATLSGTGLVKSTTGTISYITDNSTNWNTAFGWGNPSGVYLPLSGGTLTGNTNLSSGSFTLNNATGDQYYASLGTGRRGLRMSDNATTVFDIYTGGSSVIGGITEGPATLMIRTSSGGGSQEKILLRSNGVGNIFLFDAQNQTNTSYFPLTVTAAASVSGAFTTSGVNQFNNMGGSGNTLGYWDAAGVLRKAAIGSGLSLNTGTGVLTATGGSSGTIVGSGTAGAMTKFTGAGSIGNSIMTDYGTAIRVFGNFQIDGPSGNSQVALYNSGNPDWDYGTQVGSGTQDFNFYNRGTSSIALSINKSTNHLTATTPTQSAGDNSNKLASTAYVDAVAGGSGVRVINVTGTRTLNISDWSNSTTLLVTVETALSPFTLTLPLASTWGTRRLIIKKTDASNNLLTIARSGSDTIEGNTSDTANTQWAGVEYVSNGSTLILKVSTTP